MGKRPSRPAIQRQRGGHPPGGKARNRRIVVFSRTCGNDGAMRFALIMSGSEVPETRIHAHVAVAGSPAGLVLALSLDGAREALAPVLETCGLGKNSLVLNYP